MGCPEGTMPSPRVLLSAALAASLLASPAAHARFGKRTQPREHTSSSDDKVHEASAIGTDDDDDEAEAPSSDDDTLEDSGGGAGGAFAHSLGEQLVGGLIEVMVQALVYAIAHGGTHNESVPEDPGEGRPLRHAVPLSVRMGSQGLMWRGTGSGADMFLGVEGQRFGAEAHVLRLWLPAEDGSGARDYLTLVQAHVSHALLVSEQLRVRAEGGVSTARAPDATFIGPSLGLSLEACVLGPLDVEARMQVTPLPYHQLDGSVGLALHLGGLMLRGGWRGLFLDDRGGVDGIVHQERLHGPYLGAGFTF
jgi:hypothetical protein